MAKEKNQQTEDDVEQRIHVVYRGRITWEKHDLHEI